MTNFLKSAIWGGWEYVAKLAGRSYVAGSELSDAMKVYQRFARRNLTGIVCYWNGDDDQPSQVAGKYLEALDALAGQGDDCYLAIKAPALRFSRELTAQIVTGARTAGVRVHFDSHSAEEADQTLALVKEAVSRWPQIGCSLPGRWRRSLDDADRLCEMGVIPRVVKGQWEDPDHPEIDLREGFLEVIDRLAGRARHVAVASHDVPLARESVHRLRKAGTSCELELLFGLPMRDALIMAEEEGLATRLYVPYGDAWFPYCLSQMRKNPRMLKWVIQNLIFGHYWSFLDTVRVHQVSHRGKS
ncbi:MAG TPA: proline dehydrogenase [Blastocatellia bacterium]|nr:proline dehydrogenase [Blastocatellia bacterium]